MINTARRGLIVVWSRLAWTPVTRESRSHLSSAFLTFYRLSWLNPFSSTWPSQPPPPRVNCNLNENIINVIVIPLVADDCCPFSQFWRAKQVDRCVFFSFSFLFYLVSPHIFQERSQYLCFDRFVLFASKTLDNGLCLVQTIMGNEPSWRFWKTSVKSVNLQLEL